MLKHVLDVSRNARFAVERGPEMFMDPAEEESARKVALEKSVTEAVGNGLSLSKAERLRDILHRRANAFRRALRGDPPARVEPMRVQLKPGATTVKACLLYTSPSPRDLSTSRMPSSA